jgi:hypothetical protein
MKFDSIPFGVFDLVTAVVLFVGILRGRKHGLYDELLGMIQWAVILVVGGLYYRAVSMGIGQSALFGGLFCNLISYVIIALAIKLVFSLLKRGIGEKIIGADLFGGMEYYFGMIGGTVRFVCIFLFLLNFLHAPFYTPEMLAAAKKQQEKDLGETYFPTVGSLQHMVFAQSATGWAAESFLKPLLIQPVAPAGGSLRGEKSMARQREQSIDAMMGRK